MLSQNRKNSFYRILLTIAFAAITITIVYKAIRPNNIIYDIRNVNADRVVANISFSYPAHKYDVVQPESIAYLVESIKNAKCTGYASPDLSYSSRALLISVNTKSYTIESYGWLGIDNSNNTLLRFPITEHVFSDSKIWIATLSSPIPIEISNVIDKIRLSERK